MVAGKVFVNDIIVEAFIGINPNELLYSQKLEFGFELEYDWEGAVSSDSIEEAVNYATLTEELKAFVQKNKFNLVESLVFELAKRILAFSTKVISVRVYCKKPTAIPGTSGVGAEITMDNEQWIMDNG